MWHSNVSFRVIFSDSQPRANVAKFERATKRQERLAQHKCVLPTCQHGQRDIYSYSSMSNDRLPFLNLELSDRGGKTIEMTRFAPVLVFIKLDSLPVRCKYSKTALPLCVKEIVCAHFLNTAPCWRPRTHGGAKNGILQGKETSYSYVPSPVCHMKGSQKLCHLMNI